MYADCETSNFSIILHFKYIIKDFKEIWMKNLQQPGSKLVYN